MTAESYADLLRVFDRWVPSGAAPIRAIELGSDEIPDFRNAVYVADARDGTSVYVGSVCRQAGLNGRIREHLRRPSRSSTWERVWVVPIADDVGSRHVRWIEGLVGRLVLPTQNCRLPRRTIS